MTKTNLIAAAALLAASAALAAPPAAPDGTKQEKKICKTERMTGSLTRRSRICLTEAQWREVNNRTRKGVDEMVSTASGAPKCLAGAAGGIGC